MNIQDILNQLQNYLFLYGPSVLLSVVTLIVGLWVINRIMKVVEKAFEKKNVDSSLRRFLSSMIRIAFKTLLILSVISIVGIETTSFVAVLAAAGFAVGLALQGSLSNFAGGVLILIFRPFKVGDFIEAQGHSGTVDSVQIFNTVLKTPDNKTIIIPNGSLANGSITNYSAEETRRVEWIFGIGYGDDIKAAKELLEKIITSDERVLKDPEHFIGVSALADSSVNLVVRAWCKGSDYWGLFFDIQEKTKLEFDSNGISIPFPQRDIHMFNT